MATVASGQTVLLQEETNDKIFSLLFKEDELTWQTIIFDLIREEQMNPWDIDISLISCRFLERLKKIKEMNFRLTGKIVLASAILLKLKSNKLLDEEIAALDKLIQGSDQEEYTEELEELMDSDLQNGQDKPQLVPRTPQPRQRKVSVYDLVSALEKALETENKRQRNPNPTPTIKVPIKSRDIAEIMKELHTQILGHFEGNDSLTFTELLPSESRQDKVLTFVPLLHLENQQRVDLLQKQAFNEIYIGLPKA